MAENQNTNNAEEIAGDNLDSLPIGDGQYFSYPKRGLIWREGFELSKAVLYTATFVTFMFLTWFAAKLFLEKSDSPNIDKSKVELEIELDHFEVATNSQASPSSISLPSNSPSIPIDVVPTTVGITTTETQAELPQQVIAKAPSATVNTTTTETPPKTIEAISKTNPSTIDNTTTTETPPTTSAPTTTITLPIISPSTTFDTATTSPRPEEQEPETATSTTNPEQVIRRGELRPPTTTTTSSILDIDKRVVRNGIPRAPK